MTELWDADPSRLAPEAPALTRSEIDQRVFDLYDEYYHGRLDRRECLQRAGALTIGGVSAPAMAPALLPRYPGTQHGFHTNSTPRDHEAAAKLAGERTIAFFKKHLA